MDNDTTARIRALDREVQSLRQRVAQFPTGFPLGGTGGGWEIPIWTELPVGGDKPLLGYWMRPSGDDQLWQYSPGRVGWAPCGGWFSETIGTSGGE